MVKKQQTSNMRHTVRILPIGPTPLTALTILEPLHRVATSQATPLTPVRRQVPLLPAKALRQNPQPSGSRQKR